MNNKQYKKLTKFEDSLKQSESGYYRALLSADVNELADVYEELGYEMSKSNRTCSRCILGMLQTLAKEYNAYATKLSQRKTTKTNNNE